MTVRHLFTMTAGFSYNLGTPGLAEGKAATDGAAPTREMMKYLAKDPLLFEPGTKYNYSLCHDVLAALVEVLSGMRFGDYVKKVIFDPLGMKDSTFCLHREEYDSLCAQYCYNAETKTYANCGRTNGFIIGSAYEKAIEVLSGNRQKLDQVAAFLLEHESMTGEQFRAVMEAVQAETEE